MQALSGDISGSTAAAVSGFNVARRAATSVVATGGRHLFALAAGIIIARGLGPDRFGTFSFLLTGFASFHVILDLGASQAFYTLICRETRSRRFFAFYGAWIGAQIVIPAAAIFLILPQAWLDDVWRGEPRALVLLALAASFSQRVLWQTMIQICEAKRQTAYVQVGTMAIQALHLGVVWALHALNLLTVPVLFGVIIAEFAAASIVVLVLTRRSLSAPPEHESVRSILHEFVTYSGPLVVPTLLSALAAYIDTWMLQRFGGREQQAYYGIAFQYANLAILFGMSVSAVFWKELAAAHARGDDARLRQIYTNGTRVLFITSGFIAGFFVYWSTPTVVLLVGPAYADAGPVFSLALLNSMFACYGVVVGAAFLATGKTRLWSIFGTSCAVAGMPLSVILLWWFRLGALGLSAKMLILSAVFQLIYDFAICRLNGWRTDNAFRFAVGAYFLIAGGMTHALIGRLLADASVPYQIAVAGLAYGLMVSAGGLFFVYRYGHRSLLFGRDDRGGRAR